MMTFKTGHAIGLMNTNGLEVLIHVGLDTVKMNGTGFHVLVTEGQTVQAGQPLLEFDIEKIKKAGFDPITPIIITNSVEDMELVLTDKKEINSNETLMVIV